MDRYELAAVQLQEAVISSEVEAEQYDDAQVRQATVHARNDLLLLVSHVAAMNKQLAVIRTLLWVIAALAAVAVIR
jgi:hypothetical protein